MGDIDYVLLQILEPVNCNILEHLLAKNRVDYIIGISGQSVFVSVYDLELVELLFEQEDLPFIKLG